MKRFLSIMLCILVITTFCSCTQTQTVKEENSPTVIIPDYETKATLNGYKQSSANEQNPQTQENEMGTLFYANKSTKKFHLSSCSYADKIKSENLVKTDNRSELISNGYEACKKCNP